MTRKQLQRHRRMANAREQARREVLRLLTRAEKELVRVDRWDDASKLRNRIDRMMREEKV